MRKFFQISHNKENYTKPFRFHSHDFFEIYFFLDGNVTYYIENESYSLEKGDILIIPPGKLHRPVIERSMPYERYVLWLYDPYVISCEGVNGLINEITHMISEKNTRRISFEEDRLDNVKGLFDKLYREFLSDGKFSFCTAESCIILTLREILDIFVNMEKVDEAPGDVIRQVISYINANVAKAPSLDQLSAEFFVSKYYLSHKFKDYTKTTIHQYILMKKINLAKELLEKGISPRKVCDECGFTTYSNFYKTFIAKTGIQPREYKKRLPFV